MARFNVLIVPEIYRQLPLKGSLYVEYLSLVNDNSKVDRFSGKNHVVLQIPFKRKFTLVHGTKPMRVMGVRVSMDLVEEGDMDDIDCERFERTLKDMEIFEDYFPGILNVKVLRYDGRSLAAIKVSVFNDFNFATLGDFLDFVVAKNLHRMAFLGYGKAWKGCRDFIMQTFVQLHSENKIAETDEEGRTLSETITSVYQLNGRSHRKLIDHGKFLTYVPCYPDDIRDTYEREEDV